MVRAAVTKHVARMQEITFADWYAEVREMAGEATS